MDGKLQIEKYERTVEFNDNGYNALIYSKYDEFDKHSLNLMKYFGEQGIRIEIVPSKVKKGLVSSYCDLLCERVLFFIGLSIGAWVIEKYLDWLWKESKIIMKNRPYFFKKKHNFIVRCPLSSYDTKNKKVVTVVYTGEVKEVIAKIKSDFKIK